MSYILLKLSLLSAGPNVEGEKRRLRNERDIVLQEIDKELAETREKLNMLQTRLNNLVNESNLG